MDIELSMLKSVLAQCASTTELLTFMERGEIIGFRRTPREYSLHKTLTHFLKQANSCMEEAGYPDALKGVPPMPELVEFGGTLAAVLVALMPMLVALMAMLVDITLLMCTATNEEIEVVDKPQFLQINRKKIRKFFRQFFLRAKAITSLVCVREGEHYCYDYVSIMDEVHTTGTSLRTANNGALSQLFKETESRYLHYAIMAEHVQDNLVPNPNSKINSTLATVITDVKERKKISSLEINCSGLTIYSTSDSQNMYLFIHVEHCPEQTHSLILPCRAVVVSPGCWLWWLYGLLVIPLPSTAPKSPGNHLY